jgi:hypothetical protein
LSARLVKGSFTGMGAILQKTSFRIRRKSIRGDMPARRAACLRVAAATGQRKPWIAFARQNFTWILYLFSRRWLGQTSNHLHEGLLLRTADRCKEIAQLNLRDLPASRNVRLMQYEYSA